MLHLVVCFRFPCKQCRLEQDLYVDHVQESLCIINCRSGSADTTPPPGASLLIQHAYENCIHLCLRPARRLPVNRMGSWPEYNRGSLWGFPELLRILPVGM